MANHSDHHTFKQSVLNIIKDPLLSFKQKSAQLALAADSQLDYVELTPECLKAKSDGIICDMFEGHAPFKPRYVLPDYQKFLSQGCCYLELAPAEDFDDAINMLSILYHHVPSVTNMPVFLGYIDELLLPYVGDLNEEQLYRKLKRFWIMLDRTLPDAFMHANIGPKDNILCRLILKIDAELEQVAPNLTLMYDPDITDESLLGLAIDNICHTSKPHIANYPIHKACFDEQGFGIVSCYNALPLGGGANTLVRLNLKKAAELASNEEDFLNRVLPEYASLMFELIDKRCAFLHQESGFFNSFLVEEGLIDESRFAPMFGIYGMAEAVELLIGNAGSKGVYGSDETANQLGYRISKQLSDIVTSTPIDFAYKERAMLHSQAGISLDTDVTPGVRIGYGNEPDLVTHIQALAPHHQYYVSGVSEILTLDDTIKSNPMALYQLCKGAFSLGFREFSANISSNDLVRITGYMVKRSDVKSLGEKGSRINTTGLGAEALELTQVSQRQARVVSHEFIAGER